MTALAVAFAILTGIFFFLTAVYVKQHSLSLVRMRDWLRQQHALLEQQDSFAPVTHSIYNIYLPQLEDWIDRDRPILVSLYFAQALVGVYLFGILTQQDLSVSSPIMVIVIGVMLVTIKIIRGRRNIAEDICRQVFANVQTLEEPKETG